MEVKIVLGHTFGDEGKGVTVQWLCKKAIEEGKKPLVVRFSGGPQAAHTIFNRGIEHICSSFGSGVLLGVPTMYTREVYVDPICLINEAKVLEGKGIEPKLYLMTDKIITPYDVLSGRSNSKVLSDGTCGKGIYPTFERYKHSPWKNHHFGLRDAELILTYAADYYKMERIPEYDNMFRESCEKAMKYLKLPIVSEYDVLIYEGTQGLLLDMDNGFYPHVTPSKVGLNGLKGYELQDAEVYLVTRTYTTRHGNGYSPQYPRRYPVRNKYESNVDNEFQGKFKTGMLEFELLNKAYERHCIDNYVRRYNMSLNLVVTHMDCCYYSALKAYCFDYVTKGGAVIFNTGMSSKDPIKTIIESFKNNLTYKPDHIYYNDSVESNIKQLE